METDRKIDRARAAEMKITVERVQHSGMLVLSAMINGHLVRRRYDGYTVEEARQSFREEMSR